MYYSVKYRKKCIVWEEEKLYCIPYIKRILMLLTFKSLVFAVVVFFINIHLLRISIIPEIVQNNDCAKHKCPSLSIWHTLSLSTASIVIHIIFVVYSNLQHCNYQPGNIIIFKLSLVSRCEKRILRSLPAHPCQKQLAQ